MINQRENPPRQATMLFFVSPSVNKSPTGVKSYVKVPTSRKKRPAPKPPINTTQIPGKRDSATGGSLANNNNVTKRGDVESRENIGHHLVSETSTATAHRGQTANHNNAGRQYVDTEDRIDCEIRIDSDIHSDTPASRKSPSGTKATPMDNQDVHEDVTCVSVFSDSGTVSGSSGYTSDYTRPSSMTETHPRPDPFADEEEEGFGEEGFTLEFEDEDDEPIVGRQTRIYKEYQGEDFADYLQDEPDSGLAATEPTPPGRKPRYVKKKDDVTHQSSPVSTLERHNGGFKEKFSQMFTLSKQNRSTNPNATGRNGNIQNFSFADSKMGEILNHNERKRTSMKPNMSDLGLGQSWCTDDTLAARSLRRRPEHNLKHKRSSSVGDILDSDFSEPAYQPKQDFESYRKAQMYDTKDSGKKMNIWAKLGRTLKKKDKSKYHNNNMPNTTQNPLTLGDTDTDIRL